MRFSLGIAVAMALGSNAFGQVPEPFSQIFGGLAQRAARAGAREAWSALSPDEMACLDQKLAASGTRLRRLINAGMLPNDPQLLPYRRQCAGADPETSAPRTEHSVFQFPGNATDASYECLPTGKSTDNDPIARTVVTLKDRTLSIVHITNSGAEYHRADQYQLTKVETDVPKRRVFWSGIRKANQNLRMEGQTYISQDGKLLYAEAVFDTRANRKTDGWTAECRSTSSTAGGASAFVAPDKAEPRLGGTAAVPAAAPPIPVRSDDPKLVSARDLLNDAKDFLKESGVVRGIAEIGRQAAELQGRIDALDGIGVGDAERKLRTSLRALEGFDVFAARRVEARNQQAARLIAEATDEANLYVSFIDSFVAKNLGSALSGRFLTSRDGLESAIRLKTMEDLRAAVADANQLVASNALTQDFEQARKKWREKAVVQQPPTSQAKQSVSERLGLSPSFSRLLDGDPGDLVILYNASEKAPNISKSLSGGFVFRDGRATVCVLRSAGQELGPSELREIVRQKNDLISVDETKCDPSYLGTDLTAFTKATLKTADDNAILLLAKPFEANQLRIHSVVSARDFEATAKATAAAALQLESDIDANRAKGWYLLQVAEASKLVCTEEVPEADRAAAIGGLLRTSLAKLWPDARTPPTIVSLAPEAIFVGVQRKQCGTIAASASTLQAMLAAFRRENIRYTVLSVKIEPDALDRAVSNLDAAEKAKIVAAAEQKRAEDDRRRLDERRKDAADKDAAIVEARLREANAAKALGLLERLRETIKPQAVLADGGALPGLEYYVEAERALLREEWQITDHKAVVSDYGDGDWKGRRLEGMLIQLTVSHKNAVLGQYEDRCYLVGVLDDSEFGMLRALAAMPCGSTSAPLKQWLLGQQFRSRWIASRQ